MRKITQTIVGTTPPLDKNVLWLDTTNSNSPVEKVFLNGAWIPTSAAGGEYYTKDEVDENFMGKIDNPNVGNILVVDENGKAVDSTKKAADFIANPEVSGQNGEVLSVDSEGNPVWTTITPTGTADDEMSNTSTNAVQNKVIKEYIDNNCARKDGYYSQLTAGSAENLVGQTVDSEAYLIRPTGGTENEVANGIASVLGMEGNSAVWNQLVNIPSSSRSTTENGVHYVDNRDGSYTVTTDESGATASTYLGLSINLIGGHKYYGKGCPKGGSTDTYRIMWAVGYIDIGDGVIFTTQNTGVVTFPRIYVSNGAIITTPMVFWPQIIDLTLLGIDNLTTVAEVEAWLAEHVGTKPYYAYNAGTILSAQTLGIKTYGQNLLNPTTRQAKLIPYTWVENGVTYSNKYTIKNVPSGATATFTPDNIGVAETVDISGGVLDITSYGSGVLELSAATADTYVCMKWNTEKDNDVVPYEEHTYDFDVRKVYGKVNGAGEYVQCFPNGMRSAGSIHDTLTAGEAVVKVGSVDMGVLTGWVYDTQLSRFWKNSPLPTPAKGVVSSEYPNAICTRYIRDTADYVVYNNNAFALNSSGYLRIKDSSLSDTDIDSQGKIAKLSGVPLYYELATHITYTDLIYRDGGVDRPLADVLMNIEVNNWSMEEQLLTPYVDGNPTSIPATIKTQYGMDAVEAIDTLQKTCYFADDVHDNLQAMLTCINTNCAETLGGTFSISDTATDKVFDFTFTPNTEPEP